MQDRIVRIAADTEGGDPLNGVLPIERMVAGAVEALKTDSNFVAVLPGDKNELERLLLKYNYQGKGIEIIPRSSEKYVFRHLVNMHKAGELDGVYTGLNTKFVTPTITSRAKLGMIVDDLEIPPLISKMPCFKLTRKDRTFVTDTTSLDIGELSNLELGYYFALDLGANKNCSAQNLYEFAVMAKYYVKNLTGNENPRIALLNMGAEEEKGNSLDIETYNKLKAAIPELNFVGNIEKPILRGDLADIVVADGRIGNVYLKTSEAVADFIKTSMKWQIKRKAGFITKLRCSGIMKATKELNELTDPANYGGAPALGVNGHIVKTHGTFCKRTAKTGILLTAKYARSNTVDAIKQELVSKLS